MMTLYYSDILSSHRACAVAKYLNAPVEFVYLDFAKGEHQAPAYLAINSNGKVPTLVKGDRITWEADAVICQLSDDMNADLWPHDARQIDIVRWFSWNAQHFSRAGGALYFENIVKRRFNFICLKNNRRSGTIEAQTRTLDTELRGPRDWTHSKNP